MQHACSREYTENLLLMDKEIQQRNFLLELIEEPSTNEKRKLIGQIANLGTKSSI